MTAQTEISNDGLGRYILQNSKLQSSLGEIVIITTEDKIELCLTRHLKDVEKRRGWITPLGLFLTILLTFLTTDFRDWIGIPKDTWRAVFLIADALFIGWLGVAVKSAWRSQTLRDIIYEIKKSSIKSDENGAQNGLVSKELFILDAVYKTDKVAQNVTENLNSKIVDGKLNTAATNDIAGDPAPGVKKTLELQYRYNGVLYEKSYNEGDTVTLP